MPPPIPPSSNVPPSFTVPPPPLLAQKKSWWSRNWKWFVPLLAFVSVALFAGGIFAFISGISGMMKHSEPYQQSVALAKRTPLVIETLGTPITEGFMPTGNISTNNSNGEVKLSITLKGPKAKATLAVEATRTDGRWHYDLVEIHFPTTDKNLDLTQQANQPKSIEAF